MDLTKPPKKLKMILLKILPLKRNPFGLSLLIFNGIKIKY